ncbi:hypothetical protein, partial [Microbulbifer zhoushanensis]|uniref:hypothetical protein n=1 Tax=Microbulbifer zhoushanensis TaxID=2904254 RepID=UPI001F36C9F0
MKHLYILSSLLLSALFITSASHGQDEFPVLKGPYLGWSYPQKVDTLTRRICAHTLLGLYAR